MKAWSALLTTLCLAFAATSSAQTPATDDSAPPTLAAVTDQRPQPPRSPARRPAPLPRQPLAFRAYGLIAVQGFTAKTTFDGIFGTSAGLFAGGGGQIILPASIFVDVGATRFKKIGARAFRADGQTFQLGIPLTATITPIEISGGYRVRLRRHPRLVPYIGAGVGSYGYTETSEFVDDVSVRHVGYLAVGGIEVRVQRWVTVDAGAHFSHVPGILGTDGLSKDAGENDLGGTAFRFKVSIGR